MAPVLTLVFALISASAAAFNGWIFFLRPSQKSHFWLALTAVGVTSMAVATAMLYQADSLVEALRCQRAMLVSGGILILGFPRFACAFLDVERRALVRLGDGLAIASVVSAIVPELFYGDTTTIRGANIVGTGYIAHRITSLGAIYLVGVLALFGGLVHFFWRNEERVGDDSGWLVAMLVIWFATGINDISMGVGGHEGVLLVPVGYSAFLMGFTAILTRRMASSLDFIERSAARMRGLVERRTDELRERELQLARGEQMATIGTLAAGVAHEINTPIAFVSSSFNRLRELRKLDPESEDVREIFEECSTGVERIRVIVADLLNLAEKSHDDHEPLQLHDVVESALPIIGHEARGRALIRNVHEEVPDVLGDRSQLGQVVLNLVMNALQAIPEGHERDNVVEVETRRGEGEVQLIVRDTGPGIPADIKARIFDPFFTTKDVTGTGLGLAVTHQLVARHRGRIELESSPAGTTAIVSLPCLETAPA